MKKAIEIKLRVLPVAVMNAIAQMHLYPVKSQVKSVIEPLPDAAPATPLQLVASTDKSFDSAIRKRAVLKARATLTSTATANLKIVSLSEVAEKLGMGEDSFRNSVKAGMYPDYDYSKGRALFWFEETVMEMLAARDEANGVCCVKCQQRKAVWEFAVFKKKRAEVCISCEIASPGGNSDFAGSNEYREPKFSPTIPGRVGHDIYETMKALEEIRRKAGGIPTDAIRSGIVRRDEMTV